MKRQVEPELLDTLPTTDPRAVRSRRDLCRVNWWMRNHAFMARALRDHAGTDSPLSLLELGAGDGNFLLALARQLAPAGRPAKAILLDRQLTLAAPTQAAFAELGWTLTPVTADVFDWAAPADAQRVTLANLFLHHFAEDRLARLLRQIAAGTRLFIAVEPRRLAWSALGGALLGLIGCNEVTRHDGTVSIRAGFCGQELSALWPEPHRWQLTEKRGGLFSHVFIARRLD